MTSSETLDMQNSPNTQIFLDNIKGGFSEVVNKKKKRKTYEITNSAKNCKRANKVKSSEMPECFKNPPSC